MYPLVEDLVAKSATKLGLIDLSSNGPHIMKVWVRLTFFVRSVGQGDLWSYVPLVRHLVAKSGTKFI